MIHLSFDSVSLDINFSAAYVKDNEKSFQIICEHVSKRLHQVSSFCHENCGQNTPEAHHHRGRNLTSALRRSLGHVTARFEINLERSTAAL